MDSHDAAVRRISQEVKDFYQREEPFRINHGSTNSTRQLASKDNKFVNVGDLNRVLSIDTVTRTALVEPNVPMDRLVEATLKHGLIPPVVMEFPGITVGGGYAGTSGESSSWKYGFFNRTLNWVELVLADGRVVKASETDYPDLFHGAAGAVGSMGVTTCVELSLVQAKRYVRMEYLPVRDMEEAVVVTKKVTSGEDPSIDYVDGIMFSKTEGVILVGRLTDEINAGEKVQSFSKATDPWFYVHVRDRLKAVRARVPTTESKSNSSDLIPVADYLFRYDRGGFWVGRSAFEYMFFPFNRITRWFLDDFMHTRMLYRALHASRSAVPYFVQDLAVPYNNAATFVDWTDKELHIYPLWLCPLKQGPTPTFHPHDTQALNAHGEPESMLNIGVWGWTPKSMDGITANRALEAKLKELRGMKWFYAQCYYSEAEFWEIYDKPWYTALREKYHAVHLPSVWQKVRVDIEKERETMKSLKTRILGVWPIAGLYGIWRAIRSGDWSRTKRVRVQHLDSPVHGKEKVL